MNAGNTSIFDVSVLILALNEAENIPILLTRLHQQLKAMGVSYEIVVIDGHSQDNTKILAQQNGARVELQEQLGYGFALKQGIKTCCGEYVLGIDADLSHEPLFIPDMWKARKDADLVIASRFISNKASFESSPYRVAISKAGNMLFKCILSLPVKDLSSGFRLYRSEVIKGIDLEGRNFDILPEILVKMYSAGYKILEIPFSYKPRTSGRSNFKLIAFFCSYMRTMWQMRCIRMAAIKKQKTKGK